MAEMMRSVMSWFEGAMTRVIMDSEVSEMFVVKVGCTKHQ